MISGKHAFHGASIPETVIAILTRPPVSLSQLNPQVPPDLEMIVQKALEKDRELRYQHAAEMRLDLQRLKWELEAGDAPVT
jgi:serine/threonine protein kinase